MHLFVCVLQQTDYQNKVYDYSEPVNDSEEIASQYTPTPRVEIRKGNLSVNCLITG